LYASLEADFPSDYGSYETPEQLQARWGRSIKDLQKRAVGGAKDKFFRDKYKEGSAKYKAEETAYHASRTKFEAIRKGRQKITNYQKVRIVMAGMVQNQCCVCGQGPRLYCEGLGDGIEVHHIHALAYGGGNVIENFCLLCKPCHDEVHRGYKDEEVGEDTA